MTTATKATHTPGPWFLDSNGHVYAQCVYRHAPFTDNDGVQHDDYYEGLVALPYGPRGENEANARLIAAAPEMLAFIQAFKATLEYHNAEVKLSFHSSGALNNDIISALQDARALLAKIEGR